MGRINNSDNSEACYWVFYDPPPPPPLPTNAMATVSTSDIRQSSPLAATRKVYVTEIGNQKRTHTVHQLIKCISDELQLAQTGCSIDKRAHNHLKALTLIARFARRSISRQPVIDWAELGVGAIIVPNNCTNTVRVHDGTD